MATTKKSGTKGGGRKSSRMSSGAKASPIVGPRGASNTIISDPTNPAARIIADDVVVNFAGRTPAAPSQVAVGVASAQAVAANPRRKGLVLTNRSANYISFGLGAAAVLDNGITLAPDGVWQMDQGTFTTGAINAIAGGAASPLAVQEFS